MLTRGTVVHHLLGPVDNWASLAQPSKLQEPLWTQQDSEVFESPGLHAIGSEFLAMSPTTW